MRVDRVFNLDLDWTVDTVVTRIAPQRAALSVEIPLVAGESVLTDGVKVRNNEAALVGLGAGEAQTQWHSGLARAETLEVSLPADAARTEVWSFIVNPQWNVVVRRIRAGAARRRERAVVGVPLHAAARAKS